MGAKFTWGDAVSVRLGSPERYSRITLGSICGLSVAETQALAAKFDVPIGTTIYTVENPDGFSLQIPEVFLEAFGDE